jgi:hypothetical protein
LRKYDDSVNPRRKLAITGLLFAAALGFVIGAMATASVVPLFAAWVPLLVVPWILTRPEPREPETLPAAPLASEDEEQL